MKKIILPTILTFMLFAAARPGETAVLEIPLAVQAGDEPWADHAVEFDAGIPLSAVTAVRLRLAGEGGGQEYIGCEAPYPWTFGTGPGYLEVVLRGGEDAVRLGGLTIAFGDDPRAPFTIEEPFPDADFSALEEGVGLVEFADPAHVTLSGGTWLCPLGNACVIADGVLVVEYGDLVPVESVTWGALKAVYR